MHESLVRMGPNIKRSLAALLCVLKVFCFLFFKNVFNLCQSQSESNSMSKHKSSSSFTPFIDPRLLQISPSSGSSLNNMGESPAR